MTTPVTVEQLQEIHQRISGGPWTTEHGKDFSGKNWLVGFGQCTEGESWYVTTDGVRASETNGADAKDDATGLADLRNLLPSLIALAETLESQHGEEECPGLEECLICRGEAGEALVSMQSTMDQAITENVTLAEERDMLEGLVENLRAADKINSTTIEGLQAERDRSKEEIEQVAEFPPVNAGSQVLIADLRAQLTAQASELEALRRVAEAAEGLPWSDGPDKFAIVGNTGDLSGGPLRFKLRAALDALKPSEILTACAVRGDTIHARKASERVAVCGEENVTVTEAPFQPESAWSCKRCRKSLKPSEPGNACTSCKWNSDAGEAHSATSHCENATAGMYALYPHASDACSGYGEPGRQGESPLRRLCRLCQGAGSIMTGSEPGACNTEEVCPLCKGDDQ